jgi:hypothetical protein
MIELNMSAMALSLAGLGGALVLLGIMHGLVLSQNRFAELSDRLEGMRGQVTPRQVHAPPPERNRPVRARQKKKSK